MTRTTRTLVENRDSFSRIGAAAIAVAAAALWTPAAARAQAPSINTVTVNGGAATVVPGGGTIVVQVNADELGGGWDSTQVTIGPIVHCENHPPQVGLGQTVTFNVQAPCDDSGNPYTVTVVAFTDDACSMNPSAPNATTNAVVTNIPPPTNVAATLSTICPGGSTVLTATAGPGETVDWYTGACGGVFVGTGSPLLVSNILTTTTFFARARNTTTNCESVLCGSVVVNAVAPATPAAPTALPPTVCVAGPSTLSATVGAGETVDWFTGACGGVLIGTGSPFVPPPVPAPMTTYFARARNLVTGCVSAACDSVTVTANPPPAIPGAVTANPTTICQNGFSQLTATVGAGETVDWFTGACGVVFVGSGSPLLVSPAVNTTFFARARNTTTGCISLCGMVNVTVVACADPLLSTVVPADGTAIANGADTELITVTLLDSLSAPVAGHLVTLAPLGAPPGVAVAPVVPVTNAAGVATFNVTSDTVQAVSFQATDTSAPPAGPVIVSQTALVTFTPGAPANLRYVQQPTNVAANAPITPAVTVEIVDASPFPGPHRVTSAVGSVTMALMNNPCGATLTGGGAQPFVGGVATFNNLRLDNVCSGYTLAAASSIPVPNVVSNAINVTAGTNLRALPASVEAAGAATNAAISYGIDGMNNVAPFAIEFGLDTDGNLSTVEIPFAGSPINVVNPNLLTPGVHTLPAQNIRAHLDGVAAHGHQVLVRLDINDTVPGETIELNVPGTDNVSARPLTVDVRIDSVSVVPRDAFTVTVNYTVVSVANTPPFSIDLGLNVPGNVLGSAAGDVTPGTHSAQFNVGTALRANGVQAGDALNVVATVVKPTNFNEADNVANNRRDAATQYNVDLSVESVVIRGAAGVGGTDLEVPFEVDVTFVVTDNIPSNAFSIGVYASTNDQLDAADPLLGQLVVPAGSTALGTNTRTVAGLVVARTPVFNTTNFSLLVRVDDALQTNETDENNNVAARNNQFANALNVDADGDGLTAGQEGAGFQIGGDNRGAGLPAFPLIVNVNDDPTVPSVALLAKTLDTERDTDKDGIDDNVELIVTGTNPTMADSDGDGIADGAEDVNQNGVLDPGETNPRHWDTDGDGLSDFEETRLGFQVTRYRADSRSGRFDQAAVTRVFTNAQTPDTDGDGTSDFNEVNTFALAANGPAGAGLPGALAGTDLLAIRNRVSRPVNNKPFHGVRTDPTSANTDEDALPDVHDPAPQINPARFGFRPDDPGTQQERARIARDFAARIAQVAAARGLSQDLALEFVFQEQLLNFDQDGDGFLEAPDANGDGFPDFTRFNEQTIEQAFGIDFSNNGSLDDGFDVGGLNRGAPDADPDGAGPLKPKFGTHRIRAAGGAAGGDGTLDTLDSTGELLPTDNCPQAANGDQADFDGDGLGDVCDADLDNDGVPNSMDFFRSAPLAVPGLNLCGFGMVQGWAAAMLGLIALKWSSGTRRRRRTHRRGDAHARR